MTPRTPPPGSSLPSSSRCHGVYSKAASDPASRSIASKAAQMLSRKASNHAAAFFLRSASVMGLGDQLLPGKPSVCLSASLNTIAAASATLSERAPGTIGTRMRASAAWWTASGTPALSRPSSRTSVGAKAKPIWEMSLRVVSRTRRPDRACRNASQEAWRVSAARSR